MNIFKSEEHQNYASHKQASGDLKNQTAHQLTLTNVTVNDPLRAEAGTQTLGKLDGLDPVSDSHRAIDQEAFHALRNTTFNPLTGSSAVVSGQNTPPSAPVRQFDRIELNAKQEVRSITPNLVIPHNVLYRVNVEPQGKILIETNSDFAIREYLVLL